MPNLHLVPAVLAATLQLPAAAATYHHFQASAIIDAEDFMRAIPANSATGDLAYSPKFDVDGLLGPTAPTAITRGSLPIMAY